MECTQKSEDQEVNAISKECMGQSCPRHMGGACGAKTSALVPAFSWGLRHGDLLVL